MGCHALLQGIFQTQGSNPHLMSPALAGGWFFTTSAIWEAPWVSCAVLSRFSHVPLFVSVWTVDCQAPLFLGFFRQEYWSGLLCPLPGDLPNPGIKPSSSMPLALVGEFFTTSTTLKRDIAQVCSSVTPGFLSYPGLSVSEA